MYIGEVLDIKKENEKLKQENEELKKLLKKEEEYNVKIAQESVDVNGKLQQKLKVILDICKANKCIDNNGYCPQIRNIQEIIEEGR